MGSMSASDAAPLPRLGEVFFDVRGNSRSMRLSWYADTGVAVFSIWQGGTCTGTFRLPMDDLSRMIESLRRGPQGQRAGGRPAGPGDDAQDGTGGRGAGPASGAPDQGQPTVAMRQPGGAEPASSPRGEGRSGAGYPAVPGGYDSGSYRRDSSGFPAYPADPGYSADPGYPSDPGYRDGPGYPADPGYPSDPGYPDGPVTGDYRREPATPGAGYPDGPDYPDGPGYQDHAGYPAGSGASDYRGGQSGSHRRDQGGYQDDPADYRVGQSGSHRRDPGYPAEPPAYPSDPYSRPPDIGDYPGEPAGDDSGAYLADPDYGHHGDEWDDDTADHSMGGYGEDPEPEPFPYSRPPANHEPRTRGRYPGRH
jgi:hypothetical protein